MKHLFKNLFVACTFLVTVACNGQGTEPKDNPVIATNTFSISEEAKKIMGDSIANLLKDFDAIEAYHLKPTETDTSAAGFLGYKVIKRIGKIAPEHADSLRKILVNKATYLHGASMKRCDFNPTLAFRFRKGSKNFSILFALDCDMMRFIHASAKKDNIDFNPSHNQLCGFAKIFFRDFKCEPAVVASAPNQPVVADTTRPQPNNRPETVAKEYIVKKDESLKSIAENLKISEANLKQWNNLKNDKVIEGQALKLVAPTELILPDSKEKMSEYTVKKNDKLANIAKKHKLNVEDIKKWNNLTSDEIKEGQILKIQQK